MTSHTTRKLMLLASAILTLSIASAQTPSNGVAPQATTSKALQFEVATIKPNKTGGGWKMSFTPDGFLAVGASLRDVIYEAYGVYQGDLWSGGPAWLNSEKFDISAKLDVADVPGFSNLSVEQRRAMLQKLLADRFKLVVHEETKELPVYDLAIAKNGPKLKASVPEHLYSQKTNGIEGLVTRSSPGILEAQGFSLPGYASLLTLYIGRTVEDKTGIAGHYDLSLCWMPDNVTPEIAKTIDSSCPSVFTALQEQLGLKLVPAKAPLEVHVIDHVEQPSAN